MAETVQAEGGCLLLREKGASYTVQACLDGRHFSFAMNESDRLIQWFKKNKKSLTRRQVLEEPEFFPIKIQGLHFFLNLNAEICVPIGGEYLPGLVVLGTKRDGRPYGPACLDVLDWLAVQMAAPLEKAALREHLRHQQLELESLKDLKSQMIANLSHELRTPLTSVLGFAELLHEEIDGPLNAEQKRHLQEILGGGQRLLKTLSALVDMAKMDAGQYPLNVSQFHLGPLLEGVVGEIPFNGEIDLDIRLNGHTPLVYGDLQLVRQIFRQLLDNAYKYTPRGRVAVEALRKGEMLEVCVSDTGIGIPQEKLGVIFDGFYQISSGLTREYQGPGIGLALSKKLVEAHGGRLWVTSHPGEGSHFYFTLPLKPISIRHKELAA